MREGRQVGAKMPGREGGREEGWAVTRQGKAQEVDEGSNGRGREGGRQYGKESAGVVRAKGQRMGGLGCSLTAALGWLIRQHVLTVFIKKINKKKKAKFF